MEYESFLKQILRQVSKVANANFGKVAGTVKPEDNNQVLTATDIEIGQLIVSAIQSSFPSHNIIDEEAGVIDKQSEYTWVVDPIDGTSNFAQGIPMYGVMIGLLQKNIPIAGGVALPAFGEIYTAEKGKGSWCNGERLRVPRELKLRSALLAYGIDGHQEDPQITTAECMLLANLVLGVRNLRSSNSVYDAAMTARGKYGCYLNRSSKIWDNVAQHIVLEEAGCLYTDFFGAPIDYSNPLLKVDANFTWCSAPPTLHKQLQEIIQH